MNELLINLLQVVEDTATYLVDPGKRIYWGYLLTSLLLAVALALWEKKSPKDQLVGSLRSLGAREKNSIILDIKLWLTNNVIRTLVITPMVIPIATIAVFTTALMEKLVGAPVAHNWSKLEIGCLYTITLFTVSDFSRYFVHRCFHEIPFLWRFHQVHHSAAHLTPMTLYRLHPVEIIALEIRRSLAVGLTSGFFLYWFRGDLNSIDMLGINLFGFLFNFTGANLRHSQVWLSYGRLIEHIFISPAQHQIHHSSASIHFNKNYGSCLAIWDWIGNSLTTAKNCPPVTYGVAGESPDFHSTLRQALWNPFKRVKN